MKQKKVNKRYNDTPHIWEYHVTTFHLYTSYDIETTAKHYNLLYTFESSTNKKKLEELFTIKMKYFNKFRSKYKK